ncbi:TIGR02206 family membrane protein [soil metagenome]
MDGVTAMDRFTPYGTSHLVALMVLVAGSLAVVAVARTRDTGGAAARRDGRVLAIGMLAFIVPLQLLTLLQSGWDVERTLPVQLCDLAALAAPYALWTRRPWAVALTYYWGLTLVTQAALTPDLAADFPDPVYVLFWGMHMAVVWAACYLTWGVGQRPTWRGYRSAVVITATWAVSIFGFNAALGTNYGYLNAKPNAASVLDYLGEWPVYLLAEVAIILTVWALLTWPWVAWAGTRQGSERMTTTSP